MRSALALLAAALLAVATTKGGGAHGAATATIFDPDAWVVGRASGDARVAELHELRAGRGRPVIVGGGERGAIGVGSGRGNRAASVLPPHGHSAVVTSDTPTGSSSDRWWRLALCESGGRQRAASPYGDLGFFQFKSATWRSLGMSGDPRDASYAVQLGAAKRLLARSGRGQWPVCAARVGL